MRIHRGLIAAATAVVALVAVGASVMVAGHENGEASNGGCDDLYWQGREPGENRANESALITAGSPATAQVVIAQEIEIPCDGSQVITFNTSAAANAGAYLYSFIRITCLDGRCLEVGVATPSDEQPYVLQQVCTPGDNNDPGNSRGMVLLGNPTTFDGLRAGVSQVAFCGATAPARGQIAAGVYLVEVLAYQTDSTGAAAGSGARLDERALAIEQWGHADCFEHGRRDRDHEACGRGGHQDKHR